MIPYMEFSHRYPRGLLSMHLSLSDISKCTRPTDHLHCNPFGGLSLPLVAVVGGRGAAQRSNGMQSVAGEAPWMRFGMGLRCGAVHVRRDSPPLTSALRE